MTFAEWGAFAGPSREVPEDYVPETVISDEEFAEIYKKADEVCIKDAKIHYDNNVSNGEKFLARDYVVEQFHRFTEKSYAEGYGSTQKVIDELEPERLKSLFWGLKRCTCCWRHCHKAPLEVDSWEDKSCLKVATLAMTQESDCFCHCRMAKRMFRRAYLAKVDAKVDEKA